MSIRFAGWALLGTGTLSLLIAAMNIGSTRSCAGVRISYAPGGDGAYVMPSEVLRWMGGTTPASYQGKPLGDIDLRSLEQKLEKQPWVSDADLYIDRNRVLHVYVTEREPVARIFTTEGLSFFVDSSLGVIPLNASHTPRMLVFTGIPVNGRSWTGRDSLLVREVRDMARAISSDSLLSALVEQVDMDPVKGFVMVPKVGEHSIVAGDGRDLADKFRRLKLFYQQVMSRTGWSSYRELDLRFRGQVVAVPTGSASATPVKTALPDTSVVANSIAQPSPEPVKKELKERKESKGMKTVGSKRETGAGKPKAVMPAQR